MIPKLPQQDPQIIIQTWSKNDPKSIPRWVQSETKVSPTWIQTDPKTWAGKVRQGKKTRGTFLKDSSVSDCVLCRILVLCVWYLSYVQGSSLMCRGQSLVVLFLYGVKVLWRERSMAWTLYGVNALWLKGSMARTLYGVNALWRERSMTWTLYGVNVLWLDSPG